VIDQTLSQIDTAIAFFEECLDRVRYDEAERQANEAKHSKGHILALQLAPISLT